jgi:hypothetical protein
MRFGSLYGSEYLVCDLLVLILFSLARVVNWRSIVLSHEMEESRKAFRQNNRRK